MAGSIHSLWERGDRNPLILAANSDADYVAQDCAAAANWFQRGADQGNATAQAF